MSVNLPGLLRSGPLHAACPMGAWDRQRRRHTAAVGCVRTVRLRQIAKVVLRVDDQEVRPLRFVMMLVNVILLVAPCN